MNNDLISRSALVDKLQALEEDIFEKATQEMNAVKAVASGIVEGIKKQVIAAPTIDAVPVVHAEWIRDLYFDQPVTRCSFCNCGFTEGHHAERFAYCPHCGAKMDGGAPHA